MQTACQKSQTNDQQNVTIYLCVSKGWKSYMFGSDIRRRNLRWSEEQHTHTLWIGFPTIIGTDCQPSVCHVHITVTNEISHVDS